MDTSNAIGNLIGVIIALVVAVWVFLDAKAIGTDGGRMPGAVETKPGTWAGGVFLLLIIVLPIYLLTRPRYKRQLAERKAQAANLQAQGADPLAETEGVWPPPPRRPA